MIKNIILPQENIELLRKIKVRKDKELEAVTVGDFSVEANEGGWKNKQEIYFRKDEYLIITKTNNGVILKQENATITISWGKFLEIKKHLLPLLGTRIILN